MSIRSIFFKTAAAVLSPYVAIEKGVQHVKENVREDVHTFVNKIIGRLIVLSLVVFFVGFLSLFFAHFLNAVWGNYMGYLAVASFHFLILSIFAIVFFFGKREY